MVKIKAILSKVHQKCKQYISNNNIKVTESYLDNIKFFP